jgi:hypothetical protein
MKEGWKGKSTGLLVALVFALSFGGVGAFTSWVVGKTLWSAWQAGNWAKVPAEVLNYDSGHVQYRYEFNERTFLGTRIGIAAIDTDEGPPVEATNRILKALGDKAPLEILVDPDEPSRSVVDTTIPWMMVVGFLPFALGFGAVGLGALGVMVSLLVPRSADDGDERAISSDAASGFVGLALFTFLWNAIAIPIGAVMVMEAMRNGEWLMLLVLVFPLIGLLMIWGVINSGIDWIRRGGAKLHPQQLPPRRGSAFSGHVSFPRGVTAGEAFKARLACTSSGSKEQGTITHWKGEQQVRVSDVGGNRRVSFRFDPPARIEGVERDAVTQWQLDLFPEGKEAAAFSFPFKMQPPAGVEHLPEEELEEPRAAAMFDDDEPVPVAAAAPAAALNLILGKGSLEQRMEKLPKAQREQLARRLAAMTPEQRKSLEKAAAYGPMVKKLVIAVIVLFFLVQMAGVVSMFFLSN